LEKTHPAERYYEPNFPVFKTEECAEFRALCEEMSKELVRLFEKKYQNFERAFHRTGLSERGWELSNITQCLFTNQYRGARTQLEQRGLPFVSRETCKRRTVDLLGGRICTEQTQEIISFSLT